MCFVGREEVFPRGGNSLHGFAVSFQSPESHGQCVSFYLLLCVASEHRSDGEEPGMHQGGDGAVVPAPPG